MGKTQTRIAGIGLLFVFIMLSGVWQSNSGRPLNMIILNFHKLASLAALVLLVMTAYQTNRIARLNTAKRVASAITVLLFVSTIITGGLLSIGNPMPRAILTLHQILPFLTMLSTAMTLYLLLSHKAVAHGQLVGN